MSNRTARALALFAVVLFLSPALFAGQAQALDQPTSCNSYAFGEGIYSTFGGDADGSACIFTPSSSYPTPTDTTISRCVLMRVGVQEDGVCYNGYEKGGLTMSITPDLSQGWIRGTIASNMGSMTVDLTVTAGVTDLPEVSVFRLNPIECWGSPCGVTIGRRGTLSGTITSSALGSAIVYGTGYMRRSRGY